ncbi:MAG: hypothetical protein ABSE90_11750, partial [Verrucomicrobiota bacterium]
MKSIRNFLIGMVIAGSLASGLHLQAQVPPPPGGGGGGCTNCPPATNSPVGPDDSTIDLKIQYVGTIRLALYD